MKSLLVVLAIGLSLWPSSVLSAEILQLLGKDNAGSRVVPTNSMTIVSNEVLLFNGSPEIFGSIRTGSPIQPYMFGYIFTKDTFRIQGTLDRPRSFPGPGELQLVLLVNPSGDTTAFSEWSNNSGAFVRLTSSLQNYPPDKSIIIPAGSPGGRISLELSSDLLAWSPAPLGTYTAPTNHLFFRLKLERVE